MDFVRSDEDAAPPRYMAGMGDLTTAGQLLAGIGLALFHRERTGQGQLVDACLLRSAMYVQGCALTMSSVVQNKSGIKGSPLKFARADRTGVTNPAMNSYKTKDGRYLMLMGVETMRHMPGILKALGLPHLEPELTNFPKNRKDLIREMDVAFATRTEAEWVAIFEESDVWYTSVGRMEDMLHDEQANACRAFVEVPGMGSKIMSSPILFSGGRDTPVERAPLLGAHTEQVLASLPSRRSKL